MEMYRLKVVVPTIEGSFVRVFSQTVYVAPSLVNVSFDRALGWRVGVVLHNIVLNKRVGSPAVDGEETSASTDGERTAICNWAGTSGLPADSYDEVICVAPTDRKAGARR